MTKHANETTEANEHVQRLAFSHSEGKESPVDVVHLSDLRARELDHSMYDPTRLAFHLVQFVVAGEGAHWVDFDRIPLRLGDVLHIYPDQVHAFDPDACHEALLLLFPQGTLRRAHIPHLARWQASTILRPDASDFGILVELLCLQKSLDTKAAALRSATVGPYMLGTILAGLTDVVNAQQGGVDPTTQRYEALVWRFDGLLDRHHAASRSPAWYASELQTTRRTLARACRQSRDASPKRLIDARVVLEAKRRLATTADTVEAIGYDLGFSEPTNFVKFFKRVVGTTPGAFQRSLGGAA